MTVSFAVKTLIELALIVLLAYGFYREADVIRFERKAARYIRAFFKALKVEISEKISVIATK